MAFAIAIKEFHNSYGDSLIGEQKACIIKYYSSPTEHFNKWVFKRLDKVLDEATDAYLRIDDVAVKEKLLMVNERLKRVKEEQIINSDSIIEIMMGFELCDKLKQI